MNKIQFKPRDVVCIVIAVLLLGFLGYIMYADNVSQNERAAETEERRAAATPYEAELKSLRAELAEIQESVSYFSDEAEIMVGFNMSSPSDSEILAEVAEEYGITPVVVIDCNMSMPDIDDIMNSIDKNWEVMLYAEDFSSRINSSVKAVIDNLEYDGYEHTGIFLNRSEDISDENVKLLKDDGFIGYTLYHYAAPTGGQTEDGSIYFDYSYITSSETEVPERVSAMYANRGALIVVFDMESVEAGIMTESYVFELMEYLKEFADYDYCKFASVSEVVEELSEYNDIIDEKNIEYMSRATEIEQRMSELEEIINDIYSAGEEDDA